MKASICTALDPASLKIAMQGSQEMHDIIGSSVLLQSKILHDFALKMARLIGNTNLWCEALRDIAVSLAKSGDIAGAKVGISDIKKTGYLCNAVESVLKLIRIMNSKK